MGRKKADRGEAGLAVILVIAIALFVWLKSTIGWWGLGALCIGIIGLIIWLSGKSNQNATAAVPSFDEYALQLAKTTWKLGPEINGISHYFMIKNPYLGSASRKMEILCGDIVICETTTNEKTVFERYDAVVSLWNSPFDERLECTLREYVVNYGGEIIDEAVRRFDQRIRALPATIRLTLASASIKKAERLKTEKGRNKHYEQALAYLNEAKTFESCDEIYAKILLEGLELSRSSWQA